MSERQLKLFAAALFLSILIYVTVIFLMARASYLFTDWTTTWSLREDYRMTTFMMAGQAVLASIASLVLPKIFPRFLLEAMTSSPAIPGAGKFYPLFPDISSAPQRILALFRLLLTEAIVVFGFMVAFLNRSPLWIFPFAVTSLILQILVGPFRRK